ncbi:hypothetical protein FRC03_007823 [Tulasnella sp. 419]|nr:hypothetical protein FRC03_007823 [Tulasnella sp. 419]
MLDIRPQTSGYYDVEEEAFRLAQGSVAVATRPAGQYEVGSALPNPARSIDLVDPHRPSLAVGRSRNSTYRSG